jgi:SSS family solute:Na+ symporter
LPNLAPIDWLIVLLYLICVIAIGFSIRSTIKTTKDFFQAGRALPTWICTAAFLVASLGSQEILSAGAAGARFGFKAGLFFSLGATPAVLFAALYMMPLFYGSGARTVPEYLGLRFDQKTRFLNASMFVAMTVASSGIALCVMARLFQALHIFDPLFYPYGWPHEGIFTFCIVILAAFVLLYGLLAGLAGTIVNQALQFVVIVAGFLPMVMLGLSNIGGWSGLKASIPGAYVRSVYGLGVFPSILLWLLFGLVVSAGHWSTDFRVLQTAFAAKDVQSARRIPLTAAAVRLLLPFLLILPGAIAIGLPTPQSTTVIRNQNGIIYHEINVVPPEAAQGQGLVPARLDPATGTALRDSAGNPQLNYDRSTPQLLMQTLPIGLLGLGIAALLASLMSGLAAGLTAFVSVFTFDLYQPLTRKTACDSHYIKTGRWAAAGAMLLSVAVAYAVGSLKGASVDNVMGTLMLVMSLGSAPQLATFLLGMFTRRTTGDGAFAGLVTGIASALLHHGLTLPVDAQPGLAGGWITVAHRYPGFIAQGFWTVTFAFAANALVALAVTSFTRAKPQKELKGLVHSPARRRTKDVWWKRPEAVAGAILLAAIALGLFFI